MSNEPGLEQQLGQYGAWLEDHLHTGLRNSVDLSPTPPVDGHNGRRRWALVATGCLAAVALVTLAIGAGSDGDRTTQPVASGDTPVAVGPPPTVTWTARSTDSPFGDGTPVALAGGAAGFLAITATDTARSLWYSANGDTWATATPPGEIGELQSVAATTDALWLLARVEPPGDGTITLSRLYRTTDGVHWSTLTPDELVVSPLSAAGDVLLAKVMTDPQEAPIPWGWSTNGQDWTTAPSLDAMYTIHDAAAVGDALYVIADDGTLLSADDPNDWRETPPLPFVPTQVIGTSGGLLAMQDAHSQDCIGVGTGTVLTDPPTDRAGCLGPPQLAVLDKSGTWQSLPSSDKPMGFFPSPTVDVQGLLVSASIDYRARLLVTTSADLGATWVPAGVEVPVVIQQGNFEPFVATNGHDVVALASSVGDPRAVMLIGHADRAPDPQPTPSPTEQPGPTVPADATLPGVTDPVATNPPVSPPITAPVVTIAGADVPLTIELHMDSTSLVAGGHLTGTIEVTNPRPETVFVGGGCRSDFLPVLSNGVITISPVIRLVCVMQPWQFDPGVTRIPIVVDGTYQGCIASGVPSADVPFCAADGTMPPLPTGTWTLTIQNPIADVPITPASIELDVVDG